MPEEFSNLFNDYYAYSGYKTSQTEARMDRVANSKVDESDTFYQFTAGVLTGDYNEDLRRTQHMGKHGRMNDDALYFMREADGLRSHAGLNASRRYSSQRMGQSADLYGEFVEEGNRFSAEMDALHTASSTESAKFSDLQTQLESSKLKMQTNQSASSLGAYSVAAQRQMQETSRMLNELKNVKAPEQMAVDTSFIDPLTNKRVGQQDTFNPAKQDIAGSVDAMVRQDFKDRQNSIISDIETELKADTGYSMKDIYDPKNETLSWLEPMQNRNDAYVFQGTGITNGMVRKFTKAEEQYGILQTFAESRAIAEMSGMEEGFSAAAEKHTWHTSGSQLFQDADRDAVLNEIISDTTKRYETQNFKDLASLEAEFEKRKGLAISQGNDVMRRNQLNSARAETAAADARQYEQLLEQQKKEYASTLSSAGAVETSGGGVTFKDIRPS